MPIPNADRVIYNKTPLESVICQLRFPPILKIDSELPSDFQEKVRGVFPLFEESEPKISLPNGLPTILKRELIDKLPFETKSYRFKSGDEKWTLDLTREFMALSTVDYQKWEIFKEKLVSPLDALISVYSPSFFTRLGLRYRDVIRRSSLGLSDKTWAELLNPNLAGVLASPDIDESPSELSTTLALKLNDGMGSVRIRHGLAEDKSSKEECYLIDCDYYSEEKTEVGDAIGKLDQFNREERKIFKWSINDKLHTAMEPVPHDV